MDKRHVQGHSENTSQQSSPYTTQVGLCDSDFAVAKSAKTETEWACVMSLTKGILDS